MTPRMPLRMQRTATALRSPPRLTVAGVARASVKLLLGNARLRLGEMPIAWQMKGYPKRDAMAILMLGMTIGKNCQYESAVEPVLKN